MSIKRKSLVTLVTTFSVIALCAYVFLPSSLHGRHNYGPRVGVLLACVGPLDEPQPPITLQCLPNDDGLRLFTEGQSIDLKYDSSDLMADFYAGPNGQQIEIDPEIKISNIFGESYGTCS